MTYRELFEAAERSGAFGAAEWASLKHWRLLDPDAEPQEPAFYVTPCGDGWLLWALDNVTGAREPLAKFARRVDACDAVERLAAADPHPDWTR